MPRAKKKKPLPVPTEDDLKLPYIPYWDGNVRITEKGQDHDTVQKLLNMRGKECTTCNIHQPFEWFGKDKNGNLNNRCKACSRAARNSSYSNNKKQTRPYNKKKKPDLELWNKIDLYIDSICFRYKLDRDEFIEAIGKVTDRCIINSILSFRPPPGDEFFQELRNNIPTPKENCRRGKDVKQKFSFIKGWADNMTEATAREIVLTYRDGIKHKKTLVRAAIYKLNKEEIDGVAESDSQQFNVLNELLRTLSLL